MVVAGANGQALGHLSVQASSVADKVGHQPDRRSIGSCFQTLATRFFFNQNGQTLTNKPISNINRTTNKDSLTSDALHELARARSLLKNKLAGTDKTRRS